MNYTLIEKHITINRRDKEIDYFSSLDPKEFNILIENWEKFNDVMGGSSIPVDHLSEEEKKYRVFSKKYAVAHSKINSGTNICIGDISFKRLGIGKEGLTRKQLFNFLDLPVRKTIKQGEIIFKEHFEKK